MYCLHTAQKRLPKKAIPKAKCILQETSDLEEGGVAHFGLALSDIPKAKCFVQGTSDLGEVGWLILV